MDTTALVLLIIVSAVLAIFLAILSVALVYVIGTLKELKRIVARAESVAGSVESAAAAIGRTATPLALIKLIGNIVSHTGRGRGKGK